MPGRGGPRDFVHDTLPAPKPLGPEHFVKTEELQEALRGVGEIGADRFFEDIDAVFDPTFRDWTDDEW